MPTPTISSPIPAWKRDLYVEEVEKESLRLLVARHGRFDADDIVQEILLHLWVRLDEFMASYPDPVVYARAVCRNRGIDFRRRENSQRGAGTHNQRPVLWGDAPHPETGECFFDNHDPVGDDVAELVVADLERDYRWAEIQIGVPPREFEAMRLTFVEGLTDAEAGAIMGVTRESVNRWKNSGKRRLQELLS